MLGPDGRCFGLVDSWLVGRGEGDGLGEEEVSRQKGAEGSVKGRGRMENEKKTVLMERANTSPSLIT